MTETPVTTVEQKLKAMLKQREEIESEMASLDQKIAAFRTVIGECRSDAAGLHQNGSQGTNNIRDMTLRGALVEIANKNGGEINTYAVRQALIDAGLLKGDSRAMSARLYETLARSGNFESMGVRGRWKCVTPGLQGESNTVSPQSSPDTEGVSQLDHE